ncbi:MAG: Hint domain-containing protein [Paracoccus sp. (in: a-proteobacteria)]
MPVVTVHLYRTTVVNGVATVSEPFTLTINDASGNGAIDRDEWMAYTNDTAGHIGGSVAGVAALWDGATGALNQQASGFLYTHSPLPTTAPDNYTVTQSLLNDIVHAPKYDVLLSDLHNCFLAGTLIATPDGEVPAESLRAGDLVLTRDHGAQPLVWATARRITPEALDRAPDKRPIRIEQGALGEGLPRRAVEVSAQHRVMVRHDGAEYLISARHLMMAGAPGVSARRANDGFALIHIAFADHQIVLAEGAAMESFLTGPQAVRALSLPQRLSLFAAFPDLAQGRNPMTPARPIIKHRDYAAMLAAAVPA